jgi:hypothetical protein
MFYLIIDIKKSNKRNIFDISFKKNDENKLNEKKFYIYFNH